MYIEEQGINTFCGSRNKSLHLHNWPVIPAVLCSPKAEETAQYTFRFDLLPAV